MSHFSLRKTRRGNQPSEIENNAVKEFLEILKILLSIILRLYNWIRLSFVNIYINNYYRKFNYLPRIPSSEDEDSDKEEQESYVVAKGVGLMAAYTGRLAVFAVYPASPEGLVVKSCGPASITFDYKSRADGQFLVGYVPRAAGNYRLRVARFRRNALGSPFHVRVEDPPPGYMGTFGASLWHERPPPPPLLTGVVDFVTEKMFLTSDGQLLRLKGGEMVPYKEDARSNKISEVVGRGNALLDKKFNGRKYSEECSTLKGESLSAAKGITFSKEGAAFNEESELDESSEEHERDLNLALNKAISDRNEGQIAASAKKQIVSRIENLLATIKQDNSKREPQDRYRFVSKALMKELSLSLKLLNILGLSQESTAKNSPDCETKREFVIPEIRISESDVGSTDRFLFDVDCNVQRSEKLVWHSGADEAVSSRACDEGHEAIRPRGVRVLRPVWRKFGMSGLLGKDKEELTGVRLLHNVYRGEQQERLNNSSTTEFQNVINQRNGIKNINKSKNNSLNDLNLYEKNNKTKRRVKKLTESFRTLSLPDFSRIYSLSVEGLRKAKSCGDRSFRAMSNSTFTVTLKNIFEKDQVYNLSNVAKANTTKSEEGATLVRVTHYGSEYETRRVRCSRSVYEWKRYWEDVALKETEKEFGKECSLELTGIVDRGKALFDKNSNDENSEMRSSRFQKRAESVPNNVLMTNRFLSAGDSKEMFTSPSPVSKMTAFQKARDMFEGKYEIGKGKDSSLLRRRSVSERFNVTGLSDDIHSGVTPDHLGVPNRVSAVSCLGAVYQPDYPHPPITNRKEDNDDLLLWDFILKSDPNYV